MSLGRFAFSVLTLVVMNLGCAVPLREGALEPSPLVGTEFLLPVSALPDDLILQQHVTIRWQDREEHFSAVLQKRGDELLLLGLGPMNSVGFTLTLDGQGVRFENRSGREMSFEPERILADVQRVFYPWMSVAHSCTDCERRRVRAGLEVWEKIGAQRLEERRFVDVTGRRQGEIVIHFDDWLEDAAGNGPAIPGRAVLDNGWYGYELIVETSGVEPLE